MPFATFGKSHWLFISLFNYSWYLHRNVPIHSLYPLHKHWKGRQISAIRKRGHKTQSSTFETKIHFRTPFVDDSQYECLIFSPEFGYLLEVIWLLTLANRIRLWYPSYPLRLHLPIYVYPDWENAKERSDAHRLQAHCCLYADDWRVRLPSVLKTASVHFLRPLHPRSFRWYDHDPSPPRNVRLDRRGSVHQQAIWYRIYWKLHLWLVHRIPVCRGSCGANHLFDSNWWFWILDSLRGVLYILGWVYCRLLFVLRNVRYV